jgi:hypothetical protein
MLFLYFISNWAVAELLVKRLQQPKAEEEDVVLSMPDSDRDDTGLEEPRWLDWRRQGRRRDEGAVEVGDDEASGGALLWRDDHGDAAGGGLMFHAGEEGDFGFGTK